MIIGLTGKNGSGKGEAAKFLQLCGFEYYSLSDILREVLSKKKIPITRENLIKTGTKLREEEGYGALAERTLAKLTPDKNYVIDSIRNPEEVRALKRRDDFFLIKIDAPQKVRFERVKQRARESDPMTFSSFVEMEDRELKSKNPAAQQLLATEKLADFTVSNASTIETLNDNVRKIIAKLSRERVRPDWDEYFMDIARVAATRSNCAKRQVAAVLVRDKRIIATGYNGTPRGVKNCNEGGCARCNSFGPSGANLGECLCSHAEENAITQSAYHGVMIKDTLLYTTFSPCLMCTKMIINSGIREVVYDAHYPLLDISLKLLKEAGVIVRKINS
ncbi:MAG: AAA family ATPase [Deltaproteobacteria bacterium]|nr:MAG: AAA family ATPase [Deltaproteobacteria bacterium]